MCTGQELENAEPRTYQEAENSIDKSKWFKAMVEEMESLDKNKTWTLVSKPEKQKVVSCKWIFKIKDGDGRNEPTRYKARLVAKGFIKGR